MTKKIYTQDPPEASTIHSHLYVKGQWEFQTQVPDPQPTYTQHPQQPPHLEILVAIEAAV
jgi:hypothetical protein